MELVHVLKQEERITTEAVDLAKKVTVLDGRRQPRQLDGGKRER